MRFRLIKGSSFRSDSRSAACVKFELLSGGNQVFKMTELHGGYYSEPR
jgi:hypothetical protein